MVCTNCGSELREGAKFCVSCGTPVPEGPPATEAAAGADDTVIAGPPPAGPPPAIPSGPPAAPPSMPVGPPSTMAAGMPAPPAPLPEGGSSGGRSRLFLVAAVGIVFIVALAAVALVVLGGGDDDDSSGGGDSLSFPNGQSVPVFGSGPTAAPKKQWNTKLECNSQCQIDTNGELLFVAQEDDGKAFIEAFDASTGKSEWKNTKIDAGDYGISLDMYDDMLLSQIETDDDGSVTEAFDASTGEKQWRAKGYFVGFSAAGNVLLIADGEENDDVVSAVGSDDGKVAWESDGTPLGICEGKVVIGRENQVVVVDAGSGKRSWTAPVDDADNATCAGNRVYALSDGGVTAFDVGSGDRAWRASVPDVQSVAAAEGVAIASSEDEVVAFEASGGKKRWSRDRKDSDANSGFLLPVGDGKVVAFSEDDATLLGLEDGDLGKSIPNTEVSAPAHGQILYVEDEGEDLHAVDLATFEEQWSAKIVDGSDDMIAGGGRVFVLHDDSITAYG